MIGPTPPPPTSIRSTLRIGVISDAVPVKNSSSAMYNISLGIDCSRVGIPRFAASLRIESRVIPFKRVPSMGGG